MKPPVDTNTRTLKLKCSLLKVTAPVAKSGSMIEVFKTDVQNKDEVARLLEMLRLHLPKHRINFDLDDCDKILRVEGKSFSAETIILLMKEKGFDCSVLE